MQHVSQEMISDVVLVAMMLLAFSVCVVGVSTHRHHRKGVSHGPETVGSATSEDEEVV